MRAHPSARLMTLRPAAEPRNGAASALPGSPRSKRGLLSGILESVGRLLGFGNDQAHPTNPKDTGSGTTSTPGSHEPTSVQPPAHEPSAPSQTPPILYPAPGGGGQVEKPTSRASMPPASVPSASSSSAGTVAEPAPHSMAPPDAMNVATTVSTALPARDSQHISNIYGGTATSHTVSSTWPSNSSSVSSAPSPSQSPTPGAQIGHANRFNLAAAAAIGAVLGFVVVSALFWAVWLALRKRRRAYPEFASVHPKWVSVPEVDENQFTHPRDEKEDNPFDPVLCRASTKRSLASTMSV